MMVVHTPIARVPARRRLRRARRAYRLHRDLYDASRWEALKEAWDWSKFKGPDELTFSEFLRVLDRIRERKDRREQ